MDESAKDCCCGYKLKQNKAKNILDFRKFYLVLLRKEEEIAGNITNEAELFISHMVKEVS